MRFDIARLVVFGGIGIFAIVIGALKFLVEPNERPFALIFIGVGAAMVGYATLFASIKTVANESATGERPANRPEPPSLIADGAASQGNDHGGRGTLPIRPRICAFLDRTARCTTHQRLEAVYYLVPGGDEANDLEPLDRKERKCWGLELVLEHAILDVLFSGQDPVELEVTLGPYFDSSEDGIRRDAAQSRLWHSFIGQTLVAIVPIHMHAVTANDESPIDGELMTLLYQRLTAFKAPGDWLRMGTGSFFQEHLGNDVEHVGITELALVFEACEVHVDVYDDHGLSLTRK